MRNIHMKTLKQAAIGDILDKPNPFNACNSPDNKNDEAYW